MMTGQYKMMMVDRKSYDMLVKMFPRWMENNWCDFERSWSLKGCKIEGSEAKMDELYDLVRHVQYFIDEN